MGVVVVAGLATAPVAATLGFDWRFSMVGFLFWLFLIEDENEDDEDEDDDELEDELDEDEGGVRLRLEALASAVVVVVVLVVGGGGWIIGVGLTFSKKLKSFKSGNSIWSGISTILAD
jgi:hypothetical protein